MTALMSAPGPIDETRPTWAEQEERRLERQPRGWTGYKVGPESGLSLAELDALRRTGQLAE